MLYNRVSVTEVMTFKDCRRLWYFGSYLGWSPKKPQHALVFGTGVHAALAEYYRHGRQLDPALEKFNEWYLGLKSGELRQFAGLWDGIEPELYDYYELGFSMISNYAVYETVQPLEGTPVYIEQKISAPILPPYDRGGDNTPVGTLLGTLDLVMQLPDGRLWIVDHKTHKNPPDFTALDVDEQMTGYSYLLWRAFRLAEGVIYNVLLKAVPTPPRELARGGLSRDKSQKTTFELFAKELTDRKLNLEDYRPYLDYLASRGWKDFFTREWAYRSMSEVLNYSNSLYFILQGMNEAIEYPAARYPTGSIWKCATCPFFAPCKSMSANEDWETILEYRYLPAEKTSNEDRYPSDNPDMIQT